MSGDANTFKVVYSILMLPNLVGNSLVILVILKSRVLKTPINYLLLNLAVSDLLMGVAQVPRFLLNDVVDHPRGRGADVFCKIIMLGNLGWVAAISSVFSLVLIAIERYYVVVKPLNHRHRVTNKRLKVFVPLSWTAGAIFCIPIFYVSHFDKELGMCSYTRPATWFPHASSASWLVVAAVLPTGIMTVLYARVAYFLWSDSSDGNDVTLQAVRRSRKKVTITMLALSVVYAVCWFPDPIMHVVSNADPELFSIDHPAHTVAVFLIVVNSSVNPIVYAFRFEQFKRELVKIVCCRRTFTNNRVQIATRETELNDRDARGDAGQNGGPRDR